MGTIKLGLENNIKVYFHIPRVEKFSFDNDRSVALYNLMSTISARKMLRCGYQGYVAVVRDTSVKGTCVENAPIVRESIDVFPEELLGMPPDREIEFCIDTVLGTNPIYVPPYRIAPAKLKELKEHVTS